MEDEFITIPVDEGIDLRPISPSDLELLRQWKNAYKAHFFHRSEISPEQQEAWFAGYMKRSDDRMFMVKSEGLSLGCMGYRLGNTDIDFYNIIRGRNDLAPGAMGKALRHLIDVARQEYPGRSVRVRVMLGNPAVGWYRRCGFREEHTAEDHVVMKWLGTPS